MFIIPAIPAILGNFVLPMMLGAKDVAFPRLNLLSFWLYVGRRALLRLRPAQRRPARRRSASTSPAASGSTPAGPSTRPTAPPRPPARVVAATLGAFILGFSSILTGVNFIATIHMLRPKGMTWFRMPLFLWALYATSIIQILATPVLAITLLLLAAERSLGIGIFDPALGGDPVLFQHFFWFYSPPGRLHHDPAGHGRDQRSDGRLQPQAHLRLQLHRLQLAGHRAAQLPGLGPPHVRQRPVAADRRRSSACSPSPSPSRRPSRSSTGWHALQGRHPPQDADALRPGLHHPVHHRRADRPVPRRRWPPTST